MSSSDPLEKFPYLIRPCPGYINRGENASLLFGDSAAVHSLGSLDLFYSSAPCQPLAAIITLASQVFCRQKWHEVWWPSPFIPNRAQNLSCRRNPLLLQSSTILSGSSELSQEQEVVLPWPVLMWHSLSLVCTAKTPCSLPLEKCGCFCPLIISCLFK